MKTKRDKVKKVAKIVTGCSVGFVVTNAVKHVAPMNVGIPGRIAGFIAAAVLGCVVAQQTDKWTDEAIDEVADVISGDTDVNVKVIAV